MAHEGMTLRQRIRELLTSGEATARDISSAVGITEKEVAAHLAHIGKSASVNGERLVVRPFACMQCGFVFSERKRFTKPGRCPECRGTRIEPPTFAIVRQGAG